MVHIILGFLSILLLPLPDENIKELYGKRIVGPFPPEMEGDTINIKAVIFWDAGINYLEKEISIDFIVE